MDQNLSLATKLSGGKHLAHRYNDKIIGKARVIFSTSRPSINIEVDDLMSIDGIDEIWALDLSRCNLSKLPQIPLSVVHLSLASNDLKSVDLSHLSKLELLDCSRTLSLESLIVPSNITELSIIFTNLRSLDLTHTKLRAIEHSGSVQIKYPQTTLYYYSR